MSATSVDAGEMVRRQCLARTPLADFFRILLGHCGLHPAYRMCADRTAATLPSTPVSISAFRKVDGHWAGIFKLTSRSQNNNRVTLSIHQAVGGHACMRTVAADG